jgi:hypothetical protein
MAEQQHAGHEDHALDHRHPGSEPCQVVRHADHDHGADERSEDRSDAADQGHQDDVARHRPMHVGQRGELKDDGLGRAGDAGQGRRDDEDDELVAVDRIAERYGSGLVFPDRLEDMAEGEWMTR